MKAIYLKGYASQINRLAKFTLPLLGAEETTLRLAAGASFRVTVNGAFVFYGPLRAAHGQAVVHTLNLTPYLTAGENLLSVEVTAYNVNSYYLVDEPAFFAAEVVRGGKTVATASDFSSFLVQAKEQKVQKYSYQRDFVEVYDLSRPDLPVETEEVPLPTIVPAELSYPRFSVREFAAIERGAAEEREGLHNYRIPDYARVGGTTKGYTDEEVSVNLQAEVNRFYFRPKTENDCAPYRYGLYDLGKNKTGFIRFAVKTSKKTAIYALFDEILLEEEKGDPAKAATVHPDILRLCPMRSDTINALKFTVEAGYHELASFEPYTMRYLKLVTERGVELSDVSLQTYENPDVAYVFDSGNEKLNAIAKAAATTFAQNAVDVLTDCPSRERAGWLCDSFFSAESERFFTGKNKVEKHFLTTILHHNQEGNLPHGVFPMCYPADFTNENYIPNWDLWLILELERYLARTGDEKLIADFRPAVKNMFDFFAGYENEDGLLEKLDKWVFVEWSAANGFVQDVNYPTNMLYAAALAAASRVYGDASYAAKAEKIKKEVAKQSFNGEFFVDNAVRENGKLVLTNNVTETCQYYALYFGVATDKTHPKLYRTMIDCFGPQRDKAAVYPEVHPSNAFVGNYLRLEILLAAGLYENALSDCADFFYKMAQRTGTLWEHDNPGASNCHGFASKAAVYLAQACFGYLGEEKGVPCFSPQYLTQNGKLQIKLAGEKTLTVRVENGVRSYKVD